MSQDADQVSLDISKTTLEALQKQVRGLDKMLTFLISLSDEDRNALSKPSPARVEAARGLFELVRNNPGLFPVDIIDLAEGERDGDALDALALVAADLDPIQQRLQHTILALRSDLYRQGLNIYSIAKRHKDRLSLDDRARLEAFAKLVGPRG